MNQAAMDIIIKELSGIFKSQNMTRQSEDEQIYSNDKQAVKVWYDEDRKMFNLDMATLEEGQGVNFATVSSWLFDEHHNERDAAGVAGDFADTLNTKLGIKRVMSVSAREVKLPSKAVGDTTPGVEAFANRFLTLFPQYKDEYKSHMAHYGDFMYVDFFGKTAAVKLRELAEDGTKKPLEKMMMMLDNYYVDGDYTVQSIITYVIIGGAFGDKPELFDKALEKCPDATHIAVPGKIMLSTVIKRELTKKK